MQKDLDRDPSKTFVPLKWLRGASVATAVVMALAAAAPASADVLLAQAPPVSAHGGRAPAAPAGEPRAAVPQGGTAAGDPFAAPVTKGPLNPYQARPALEPVQKTIIQDQVAYERLMNNSGITVQWLWSAKRGHLKAQDVNDVVKLEGTQANHEGTLKINGEVVAISKDRFRFRGTILILEAPDKGRHCERTGDFDFRISGQRKYWRLQQMEFCDRLTDYVDVYF
ncbi:hypothetical protein [Bordetella sp. N]|uniref:hypothetical protein n=1 Tax=Bordetella sp. N TaxID=1746199 RepID=UPI000709EBFE|nr:hypothetical protein [Bordetella sp. N]ALM86152.1 hypothetical protein ASB57_27225 [Bordetella sp. N]